MMEMEEYKRLKERRKRNVTSYVTQRIVKMNLGNLSEKKRERKGVYCARCRSKDNVEEIGQLIKDRKIRKEISLSGLRSRWRYEWDDRWKGIETKRNISLTMSSSA